MSQNGPSTASVVFIAALTAAVVSIVTLVLAMRFGGKTLEQLASQAPSQVQVPELSGMARTAADALLESRDLLLVVAAERPDPAAQAGTVTEQIPLAGSRVSSGTQVSVVVSSGVPQLTLPVLTGQGEAEARKQLEQLGLVVGPLDRTGKGTPGQVVATTPAAGAAIEAGQVVILQVAGDDKITVPKLQGQHVSRAKKELRELGLKVGSVRERYSEYGKGLHVLDQEPAAGEAVAKGTAVSLVINEGD